MKKRKMLRATTLVISALVILFLLFCTYFLFYRNLSAYNRQVEVTQKDLLVSFQTITDETLNNSIKCVAEWMMKEDVEKLSDEGIDYFDMMQVYQNIAMESFLYQDADCVFGVFRPDVDMFITNKGMIHSYNLEQKYDFVANSMSYMQQLPKKEFVNNCYLADDISNNKKRINLFIKRSLPDSGKEIYGFVSLNLDELLSKISYSDDTSFYVFKNDDMIFSSSNDLNFSNMHILKEKSDYIFELNYANGIEKRDNMMVAILYIVLFFLLSIIGLCGSVYLSRFLYRPIESVLQQLSDEQTLDLYDEADYIKNRFVEINAKNQLLVSMVETQEQYLKQNFIRELLYGAVGEKEFLKKSDEYDLECICGKIAFALLEENNNVVGGTNLFGEITSVVKEIVEDCTVVSLNSGQLVIVCKNIELDTFRTEILKTILHINAQFGVNYRGAVCDDEISSALEINGTFNEAKNCLSNVGFGNEKLIITKKDIEDSLQCGYYYPIEYEQSIISNIEMGKFESAMQILKSILYRNLFDLKLERTALAELEFALAGTVKRILQMMKKTESEILGEGRVLYQELNSCKNPEELIYKIDEIFVQVRELVERVNEKSDNEIVEKIKRYIHEHYNRGDMSLVLLAEHFNLSTGYISKMFKKHFRINFKDYLTEYRMEKATEILNDSPYIRIVDLAQQVGYDNPNSFIRNFKKIKQISPGEYKKRKL